MSTTSPWDVVNDFTKTVVAIAAAFLAFTGTFATSPKATAFGGWLLACWVLLIISMAAALWAVAKLIGLLRSTDQTNTRPVVLPANISYFALFLGIAFFMVFAYLSSQDKSEGLHERLGTRDQYELSAQCSQESAVWYKENQTSSSAAGWFTNHYNSAKNRCFAIVYAYDSGAACADMHTLYNVVDRSPLGQYCGDKKGALQSCEIEDKKCKSEIEWINLAKSYMSE